jgi:hypothetical protein
MGVDPSFEPLALLGHLQDGDQLLELTPQLNLANSAPNPGVGKPAPRTDLLKPSISDRSLASVLALSAAQSPGLTIVPPANLPKSPRTALDTPAPRNAFDRAANLGTSPDGPDGLVSSFTARSAPLGEGKANVRSTTEPSIADQHGHAVRRRPHARSP